VAEHARGARHAEARASRLPPHGACAGRPSREHRTAVGDEATNHPVNTVLVANICGRTARELLVELVPRLTHGSALLAHIAHDACHVSVGHLRYVIAELRDTRTKMPGASICGTSERRG
jgi:hypothetical protein